MAFDFGRSYMLGKQKDDEEPKGITVNQLIVVISLILTTYKNAFNVMALREKVARSLGMDVGEITIADMQSALDQLQTKQLIKRTKNFNLIGCPGLGKALRKLLV
ncbi:MAG: hypothetical protein Q8R34_00150 [bacterium]|nr:hypothetical protein [bacterium]